MPYKANKWFYFKEDSINLSNLIELNMSRIIEDIKSFKIYTSDPHDYFHNLFEIMCSLDDLIYRFYGVILPLKN